MHAHTRATYVFVPLLHKAAAIDLSVEHDFPDVLRILTVSVDTAVPPPGHTASVVPRWTAVVTMSVLLCLPLADGKGAFAPRLGLLYKVLRHCDMRVLMQLTWTSKFN